MILLGSVINFVVRLALNIVLWLLMPILTIAYCLLALLLGLAGLAVVVCYAWFMWGVAILVFDHAPSAAPKALHMMVAGGWRMVVAIAASAAIFIVRDLYESFAAWLERGGFLIRRPADAPFLEAGSAWRGIAPSAWNLWARLRLWRAQRILRRHPVALEIKATRPQ